MALFEFTKDRKKIEKLSGGKLLSSGYSIITEYTLRKADYNEKSVQVNVSLSVFLDKDETYTKEGRDLSCKVLKRRGFIFRIPKSDIEKATPDQITSLLYKRIESILLKEEANAE